MKSISFGKWECERCQKQFDHIGNPPTCNCDDEVTFKIVRFEYFPNSDEVNNCIAVKNNGDEIRVDPFVGCAWKYENRDQLLNTWFVAKGHWHESEKHDCPLCFLPRENCMKILQHVTETDEYQERVLGKFKIDETDKCYLINDEYGHLTCSFNHTLGAKCLIDDRHYD